MSHDPVCGAEVDPKEAPFKFNFNGKMYYFCSFGCLEYFKTSPGKYTKNTND